MCKNSRRFAWEREENRFALRNRGRRAGDHVVLAFVDGKLAAFDREHVAGHDSDRLRMRLDTSKLGPGRHELRVGDGTETFRVR